MVPAGRDPAKREAIRLAESALVSHNRSRSSLRTVDVYCSAGATLASQCCGRYKAIKVVSAVSRQPLSLANPHRWR